MALNRGQLIEQFRHAVEQSATEAGREEFIYALLHALDRPKATITKLRNGDPTINVANRSNALAVRQSFYFERVNDGSDVHDVLDARIADPKVVAGRSDDPRVVIVTDFESITAWDVRKQERMEATFAELDRHYGFFLPIYGRGYEQVEDFRELEADVKAARKLGHLFDELREANPVETAADTHALNIFLTRLLFCFFAEDTRIFGDNQFSKLVADHTAKDGSDLSATIQGAFDMMDVRDGDPERAKAPKHLADFRYVNGGLFEERVPAPAVFTAKARRILLDCGGLNWREINPDIFGSMFQAVVEEEQRSSLGQHYTSVPNIMKVIAPLFLDTLRDDLEAARGSVKKLEALLTRLHHIKILDPACGSGNFLIIAYKELRRIEMDVLEALQSARGEQANGSIESIMVGSTGIRLSQFYGIEIDDFAHKVAMLSLWIAEHQANQAFEERFGSVTSPLPLKAGGNIVCDNALQRDWESVCPHERQDEVYLIGNPPFRGRGKRSEEQLSDMTHVFHNFKKFKELDLSGCWFFKGAHYIKNTDAQLSFVTTNSINQGIQVAILWPPILRFGVKIRFAYQGFKWSNSARDQAGVHVSVIGLTAKSDPVRRLFSSESGSLQEVRPSNISPYLLSAGNTVVADRRQPLTELKPMLLGSMAKDGGHLMITAEERSKLLNEEPNADRWVRRIVGAEEFLKGKQRWCLWLVGASAAELSSVPFIRQRVEGVREKRLTEKSTLNIAETPHLFAQIAHPEGDYILVPRVTSERRQYAPIGFFGSDVIATDLVYIIPLGTIYDFGILQTRMHMLWLQTVGGRLKSDFRYSNTLVYNTFPWPEPTAAQRESIEQRAQDVLDTRALYPAKTMSELYDPDKMPADLLAAHRALDLAVEQAYRSTLFRNDNERLEYLFKRYETLIAKEAQA
ncbi:class I SAM-dependent DNA methyltransferase [Spiribacter vilamensis]|uniref:site-specific DNA-methyltransferase (adenine-specific) n=1 Tax=Spiribacter vilamensis TaxID=531306 RepID=A0A4Q8D2Z0_9GAMM|nr:DNA methyltransferase [Spiribacter vilamensis]RZU99722.1 type II restriction/modification system DNA methylase subunit YeeA [Spiribacter vilamensis]TVO61331.1 class I SAM-dependent DNA methyltransferase [Spiribacter vilamensis]